MMPEIDGFKVCKKIREVSSVPVIMLTAKEDEVDKVLGLELGADDYITKPFGMRELIARVNANIRRVGLSEAEGGDKIPKGSVKVYHNIVARIVRGQTLSLKHKEFVEAARVSGLSRRKIVIRHIIPNVLGVVMVYASLLVPH